MKRLCQSLLARLAGSSDSELARQVRYLKEENRILRDKLPKRLAVTCQERQRLLKVGKALGEAIKELITIVSPRTFTRWLSGETPTRKTSSPVVPSGRPRTEAAIRDVVLRLARETGWGYTRILGELKKLGVRSICRSTVKNILRENGFDPGPKRGAGTWDEFLKRHAQTLWACDFFSKKVWTMRGMVEVFVLFFIHLGSRRVHVTGMTAHPDKAWMVQQARNVSMIFGEQSERPRYLLRDLDTKFVKEFDAILESDGLEVKAVGPLAPNLNAHAERWVQSVKAECLDHFIVFGESHLRHLITEYTDHYYNTVRPHQGMDNVPLTGCLPAETSAVRAEDIVCEERLGGLLKHFHRRAS